MTINNACDANKVKNLQKSRFFQIMKNMDIEKAAEEAMSQLLPSKSRKIYEKQFTEYRSWCADQKVKNLSEEKALLAYFFEKSKKLKASTVWSQYSMLKTKLIQEINVDISKYAKLVGFLKRINDGYKPKKSRVLDSDNIKRFLETAPDKEFLVQKVALIMGVAGACRGQELCQLDCKDVKDHGEFLLVDVTNTKNQKDRSFVIKASSASSDIVGLVRKYIGLRPYTEKHSRFFVSYRNGQCSTQPIGKNTFGQLPSKIAQFLDLPEPQSYTGHCFRRTSATMLADSGANIDQLKRHGGWKSTTVAEGYVENSIFQKKTVSDQIFKNTNSSSKNMLSKPICASSSKTAGLDGTNTSSSSEPNDFDQNQIVEKKKQTTASKSTTATTVSRTEMKNMLVQNMTCDSSNQPPFFNWNNCSNINLNIHFNGNNNTNN